MKKVIVEKGFFNGAVFRIQEVEARVSDFSVYGY